jgi:glycosyltransferase involved in cell wall biosynthesis
VRLLATAYACEPNRGSEPGAGWALARSLASFADTHVITRTGYREAIEAELPHIPERDSLHFHYVQLPRRAAFYKKGQRGIRLHYILWLRAAHAVANELSGRHDFDAAWHLTMANAWLGSPGGPDGMPFIYGPVGGGVVPPAGLLLSLGPRGMAYEGTRLAMRAGFRYLNPMARSAVKRSSAVLVQNPDTAAFLPRKQRGKALVFQNALFPGNPPGTRPSGSRPRVALFASRLLAWKGAHLAVGALEYAPAWRLIICGDGPDGARLRRIVERSPARERIELRGAVSRDEVLRTMREEAGAFILPSLHDDSPLAVAEAVASGLPVVCLDRGGPPIVAGGAGIAVEAAGRRVTEQRLANALEASLDLEIPTDEAARLSLAQASDRLASIVKSVLREPAPA